MAGESKAVFIDKSVGYHQNGGLQTIIDASQGGQNGPAMQPGKYTQNAADVIRSWQVRVIDFPRWTYFMENPAAWQRAIKAFVETHTIHTGIEFGLSAEYLETQIGHSDKIQYDAGRVVEASSNVNMTTPDKYGAYFQRMLSTWLKLSVGDPATGRPSIAAINKDVKDHLPDMYSMSLLYYRTDAYNKEVLDAVYIVNMAPRSDGAAAGFRDHTAAPQLNEMSIDWTGLQTTGWGIMKMAQDDLERSKLFGLRPDLRKAWIDGATPDVNSTTGGVSTVVDDIAKNLVK